MPLIFVKGSDVFFLLWFIVNSGKWNTTGRICDSMEQAESKWREKWRRVKKGGTSVDEKWRLTVRHRERESRNAIGRGWEVDQGSERFSIGPERETENRKMRCQHSCWSLHCFGEKKQRPLNVQKRDEKRESERKRGIEWASKTWVLGLD